MIGGTLGVAIVRAGRVRCAGLFVPLIGFIVASSVDAHAVSIPHPDHALAERCLASGIESVSIGSNAPHIQPQAIPLKALLHLFGGKSIMDNARDDKALSRPNYAFTANRKVSDWKTEVIWQRKRKNPGVSFVADPIGRGMAVVDQLKPDLREVAGCIVLRNSEAINDRQISPHLHLPELSLNSADFSGDLCAFNHPCGHAFHRNSSAGGLSDRISHIVGLIPRYRLHRVDSLLQAMSLNSENDGLNTADDNQSKGKECYSASSRRAPKYFLWLLIFGYIIGIGIGFAGVWMIDTKDRHSS